MSGILAERFADRLFPLIVDTLSRCKKFNRVVKWRNQSGLPVFPLHKSCGLVSTHFYISYIDLLQRAPDLQLAEEIAQSLVTGEGTIDILAIMSPFVSESSDTFGKYYCLSVQAYLFKEAETPEPAPT
jgi:hypothetical protein